MATYYFSDNQSGAHASASPGNNSNPGTDINNPKRTLAGFNLNALNAGDQVLFAQGGAWDNVNIAADDNRNTAVGNPIVFGDYAPPSGATGVPILRGSSGAPIVQFSGFGSGSPSGPFTVQNLKLEGVRGIDGVLMVNNVRGCNLLNLEISGCDHGIYGTDLTEGQSNTDLVVRNCNVHHNYADGVLGGADGMIFEDSTFSNNGERTGEVSAGPPPVPSAGSQHNIYINGHGRTRVLVRNCHFYDPGTASTAGTNTQGNFTVHGEFDQIIFENNLVENSNPAAGSGGININQGYDAGYSEVFERTVVRGNVCVNCLIDISQAPGIRIENNVIVWTATPTLPPIWLPSRDQAPTYLDVADTGAKIRNNSIYLTQAGNTLVIIQTSAFEGIGSNAEVTNNLIYVASNAGTSYAFGHEALASYTAHRNNLVYAASGTTNWSSTYSTLAAAQAAGFDTGSLNSNPLLAATPSSGNGYSMKLQSGSPARAAGNTTYRARLAFDGWLRPATPSIGAYDDNNP